MEIDSIYTIYGTLDGKYGFQIIGRMKKQKGFAIMCINILIKKKM